MGPGVGGPMMSGVFKRKDPPTASAVNGPFPHSLCLSPAVNPCALRRHRSATIAYLTVGAQTRLANRVQLTKVATRNHSPPVPVCSRRSSAGEDRSASWPSWAPETVWTWVVGSQVQGTVAEILVASPQ